MKTKVIWLSTGKMPLVLTVEILMSMYDKTFGFAFQQCYTRIYM